jgi:Helix-turn-helix domain
MTAMPHPTTPADPLLTPQEAAALLRVSPDALRRWRTNRTGPPGIKLGRRLVYLRSDCLAFVEAQRREQHPELSA